MTEDRECCVPNIQYAVNQASPTYTATRSPKRQNPTRDGGVASGFGVRELSRNGNEYVPACTSPTGWHHAPRRPPNPFLHMGRPPVPRFTLAYGPAYFEAWSALAPPNTIMHMGWPLLPRSAWIGPLHSSRTLLTHRPQPHAQTHMTLPVLLRPLVCTKMRRKKNTRK